MFTPRLSPFCNRRLDGCHVCRLPALSLEAPTGYSKRLGLDPVGVEQERRWCLIAQVDNDLVQDRPRPGRLGDEIVSSVGTS
jgi:hypothetical protein